MIRCQQCGNSNLDGSHFCDECGTRLSSVNGSGDLPDYVPPPNTGSEFVSAQVTSIGIPPVVKEEAVVAGSLSAEMPAPKSESHALLVIERGEAANTEFPLTAEESNIGRWDADNGIFPDVDLDAHDPDAKVSRRHARIIRRENKYFIEDLGSTNGTFVNRGRRLLPGNAHVLSDGDEIIVGKTFLRFRIN